MNDDYRLFGDPADGGEPVDPDVALISAYLSRDLSPIQVAALEQRLVTDPSFREAVQPIIDAWALLGPPSPIGTRAPLLTPANVEAGWMRHVAAERARAHQSSAPAAATQKRKVTMTRIAATIGIILLPVLAAAEVVVYAANHVDMPGHALARRVVSSSKGAAERSTPTAPAPAMQQPTVNDAPPAGALSAQHPAATAQAVAGQQPAAHPLGPIIAVAKSGFTVRAFPRVLPSGAVLVNDQWTRLVTRLDASLANSVIVLDSAFGKANGYPPPARGPTGPTAPGVTIIPFVGDSLLWLGPQKFQVIAPDGTLGRVLPIPPLPAPGPAVTCGRITRVPVRMVDFQSAGAVQWSSLTGLIYTENVTRPRSCDQDTTHRMLEDSVFVVRHDYTSGVHDTLTGLATVRRMYPVPMGFSSPAMMSFMDEVVVTTDGTICIFHAHDFRFEWIGANETRLPGPRLPFAPKPISPAERQRLVDSANTARRAAFDSLTAFRAATIARTGEPPSHPLATPTPDGHVLIRQALDDPPRLGQTVVPMDVPDVYPPTPDHGSVLADAENRVWIRLRASTTDPDVETWEVISRTGGVVDRVRVPRNRTIIGFAPGFIYLVAHDEMAGTTTIEKARIRP